MVFVHTMTLKIPFLAAVVALAAGGLDSEWVEFQAKYDKQYISSTEESNRYSIFQENLEMIKAHNEKYASGQSSYYMAVNKFADLTAEEYEAQISGLIMSVESLPETVDDVDVSSLPSSVDWREEGYVTKVQDQGLCGSCWAFSAVGAIEGQHKAATDVLIDLSESQLVDCSSDWGNDGCDGGWMQDAFQYVIDVGGIEAEETYPYVPLEQNCFFDRSEIVAKISSYRGVPHGSESALQEAVAMIGPVSIALDAGQLSFSFYAGGLYDEPECNTTMLNHGALVVGYGTTPNAQDYWIVKNSWGVHWGDRGYIYMSRNKDNQCGVATDACYPLV